MTIYYTPYEDDKILLPFPYTSPIPEGHTGNLAGLDARKTYDMFLEPDGTITFEETDESDSDDKNPRCRRSAAGIDAQ